MTIDPLIIKTVLEGLNTIICISEISLFHIIASFLVLGVAYLISFVFYILTHKNIGERGTD
jgi:hypothetical protein